MDKLDRSDIEWIAGNSNWSEAGVSKSLEENVYSDRASWQKFLSRSFLGLGVSFSLAGIFFFFAYNWERLHRFAKLGLLEGLLLVLVLGLLLGKPNPLVRKTLLTAASLLIGALYAVHGQVYQSGADAFDLFVVWTLMISLWVWVANFAPLWLLYIALINISVMLYADQGAPAWFESGLSPILISLNLLLWGAFELLPKWTGSTPHPQWLIKLLAVFVVILIIFDLPMRIISDPLDRYWPQLLLGVATIALGLWYGIRTRQIFYVSSSSFTGIILIASLLLRISHEGPMLLAIGLFIAGSVGLLTKILIDRQRKWTERNS